MGKTKHILDTFRFLLQVCRYLLEAAESGDVNTTKRWAYCDSDSCTTDDGRRSTPLIVAAFTDNTEVVQLLLEGGADVHGVNVGGFTPLHMAAIYNHVEGCRLLLDNGAKVDTKALENSTALYIAARNGYFSLVKLLLERGANIKLKNRSGLTAEVLARTCGHRAVVDWLKSVSRV
jgi:ankyrin repeat protein